MDIPSLVSFLKEIEQFKTCERACSTSKTGRAESDAEHSWHLAVFLLLLEKKLGDVDFTRLLKIALIHDLPEIYAGDTNPYRDKTDDKEEMEKQAAQKLFGALPEETGRELAALFEEYQKQETPEAKIVKSADKLMPLIQNLTTCDKHSSYRNLKVEYHEVVEYMSAFFPTGGVLKIFYNALLDQADKAGVFYRPEGKNKDL